MQSAVDLHELRGFEAEEVQAWLENCITIDALLRKVATSHGREFWEHVSENKLILTLMDSVLSIFPRDYEPEETQKYFGMRDDVKKIMINMMSSVSQILMKIATNKDKVDLLYGKQMITASQVLKMAPIVDAKNADGIVNKLLKASKNLNNAFEQYCAKLMEDLMTIDEQFGKVLEDDKDEYSPRECVFVARLLGVGVDLFASLVAAFDSSKSARQAIVRSHFIQGIPSFIESTHHWLEDNTLQSFAQPKGICRIDRLKSKRKLLAKLGVETFQRIYEDSDTTGEERFRILEQAVFMGQFLVHLNEVMPVLDAVDDLIMNRICGKELKTLVADCLANAKSENAENLRSEEMENEVSNGKAKKEAKGYLPRTLREFSDVRKVEIFSMVSDIQGMLPQISKDAIIECMYHFKFDNEQTLNGLLDTDSLPGRLRKFVTQGIWEESDDEEEDADRPSSSRALFSMAPVKSTKPIPKPELSKEEKRLEEKKKTVDKAVDQLLSGKIQTANLGQTRDAMKLQAIKNLLLKRKEGNMGEAPAVRGDDGSLLVPMNIGKKKEARFMTTEEERKSLKAKFASFAYVMSSEEDAYDDDEWSDEDEEKAAIEEKKPVEPRPIKEVQRLNEYLPPPPDFTDEDEEEAEPEPPKPVNTKPTSSKASSKEASKPQTARSVHPASRGGRGGRGGGRGAGTTGKRGGKKATAKKLEGEGEASGGAQVKPRKDGYTGGKGRMMKERRKGQSKQRGADRKRRGGMF